jgi:Ran GTPase-activating protein (RanGAP) involved in mRNA processing and transport
MLESLGLSENRLTSKSLPSIVERLSCESLLHLDLSFNDMHTHGARALGGWLKRKSVLRYLDLSNCQLQCPDARAVFSVLNGYTNSLEEVYLSCNSIAAEGAAEICSYLMSVNCHLRVLDLAWNSVGEEGSLHFSAALSANSSLTRLNLAANSLNDLGGQRLAESVGVNKTLADVTLSQNGLSDRTSFVLSRSLRGHPTMSKLDLSMNPLVGLLLLLLPLCAASYSFGSLG